MKISFKNIKSYYLETSIKLKKFNVVLGQNSSGKSNLSKAIENYFNFALNYSSFDKDFLMNDITQPEAMQDGEKSPNGYSGAVFPRYYPMSNVKELKQIKPVYYKDSKFLFDFKFSYLDFERFNHTKTKIKNDKVIPKLDNIYFTYDFIAKSMPTRLNQSLSRKSVVDEWTQSHGHFVKDYSNKVQTFLEQLTNHPESAGHTFHNVDVSINKNYSRYEIDSKEPFLDGLTIINDNDYRDSFMFFRDGSKMTNLIKSTAKKLTISVFEDQINFMEEQFEDYISSYKRLFPNEAKHINSYPTTLPLDVDQSKWGNELETVTTDGKRYVFQNHIISLFESVNNLWNISPYVNAYFYKPRINLTGIIGRDFFNIFPKEGAKLSRNINPQVDFRLFDGEDLYDLYIKNPLKYFEWKNSPNYQAANFRQKPYTDLDFYKDFTLKRQSFNGKPLKPNNVYKLLSPGFYDKRKCKAVQPGYGVLFSISNPSIREGVEDGYKVVKRDVLSDVDEIRTFLKEVGAIKILEGFELVDERHSSGRIRTFRFNPQKKHFKGWKGRTEKQIFNQIEFMKDSKSTEAAEIFLSEYSDHFEWAMRSSNFLFNDFDKKLISKAAKKYSVPKKAIYNQIDIIRMYLLRNAILQFNMNVHKYLYYHFSEKFNHNIRTSLDLKSKKIARQSGKNSFIMNTRSNATIITIDPIITDITNRGMRVTKDDLVKLFGKHISKVINAKPKPYKDINNIKRFKNFINRNLEILNEDFRLHFDQIVYKNGEIDKSSFSFGIKQSNDSKALPISEVGMGQLAIIKIIGTLYQYDKITLNSKPIVVLKEPESYLHPNLISKLVEYLFNFSNDESRKNLRFIVETHSESVLRKTQLIQKNIEKDGTEDKKIGIFYIKKDSKVGSSIVDLGLKANGFLSKKVPTGFFDVNSNLIADLWSPKKK